MAVHLENWGKSWKNGIKPGKGQVPDFKLWNNKHSPTGWKRLEMQVLLSDTVENVSFCSKETFKVTTEK